MSAASQARDFGPRGPGSGRARAASRHGRQAPRLTVRLRLTLFYGAMFLVSGASLLAFSYTVVVSNMPPGHPGAPPPPATAPRGLLTLPAKLHDIQAYFFVDYGTVLAVMAAVSLWLGWLMAGRMLRPLRDITVATRRISEENLHQRLALPGPRDEITDLGDTIDGLLARLEDAFDAQRGFVANASHELRTPLAMIRTSLDVAARKPQVSADAAVLAGKVREGLDQAERLVESFLSLARAQRGLITDRTVVSLARLAASALDARAADIASRNLTVRHNDGDADVTGSQTLLAQMAGNLIDNAVRHNEAEGCIEVTTMTDGPVARLIVETGGPVLDPGEVQELAQPFRRLTAPRTSSGDGTGLGLSIVAAIAAAHHGSLRLNAQPQGGLQVIIELPGDRVRARIQAAA